VSEQHGFRITVEVIMPGSYAEAHKAAMTVADEIAVEVTDGAHIVVTETGESLLTGPPGSFCEGCDGYSPFEGMRWPTATNGDTSREWVERCDKCERYESDDEAALALREIYEGNVKEYGEAKPCGLDTLHPYLSTD
jgi:hypothetical protein